MNSARANKNVLSVLPRRSRRKSRRNAGDVASLRIIAMQARPGTSATVNVVADDFRRKALPTAFTIHPPRQLGNQTFWARYSAQTVVSTSTSAIFESNYAFSLSGFITNTQIGSLQGVFDQYAIYCVVASIANNSPEGGTGVIPQVYTAIDFDNVSNLGSLGAISEFESINVSSIAPGNSVTRTILPVLSTGGWIATLGGFYPSVLQRSWVDLQYPAMSYYGFRSITNNTPGAAVQLDFTFTLIVAFRNTV
jgi:hypothetical protein